MALRISACRAPSSGQNLRTSAGCIPALLVSTEGPLSGTAAVGQLPVFDPWHLDMVVDPVEQGTREAHLVLGHQHAGSSSKNRTPQGAREISPGWDQFPPPASPA